MLGPAYKPLMSYPHSLWITLPCFLGQTTVILPIDIQGFSYVLLDTKNRNGDRFVQMYYYSPIVVITRSTFRFIDLRGAVNLG
jgi:hypothetical protein